MQMIDVRQWIEFAHKKLDNIFPESFHDRGYRRAMYDADRWMAEHFIEAEPVRHGYWENANSRPKTYIRKCSVCGKEAYFCGRGCSYKFCPNCGAKMDGDSGK